MSARIAPSASLTNADGGFQIDGYTVTFIADTSKLGEPVSLRLPGHGTPALTKVVRAAFAPADIVSGMQVWADLSAQLWLVDDTGRVVGRSAILRRSDLDSVWPRDALQPLADAGIEIVDAKYFGVADANRDYPGAIPHAAVKSRGPLFAVAIAIVVLIVAALLIVNAVAS